MTKISALYESEKDSRFLPASLPVGSFQNQVIGMAWAGQGAGSRNAERGWSPGNYNSDVPSMEWPGVSFVKVTRLGWALMVR